MLARRTLLFAPLAMKACEGWQVIHRDEKNPLDIIDFAAAGDLAVAAGRRDGESWLLVRDEGWVYRPLPEKPEGVAIAGASIWLAGETGIWLSSDFGRTWTRKLQQPGLLRVLFVDAQVGFAVGEEKTAFKTVDGGANWTPVPEAAKPSTNAAHTSYHWIHFVTPRIGVISGASRPPRSGVTSPLPAWRDPARHDRRKEWPAASLTLETRDGGETWRDSSTSLFGKITRVRYARDARGLALVEFHDEFEYPSEIFSIDLRTGKSDRAFRRADRAVTDFALFPGPKAWLVAIEPPADASRSTLGRLALLTSDDLADWRDVELKLEIKAGRAWIAGGPEQLLVATDTGYILGCA